jgi:hypothetical protein
MKFLPKREPALPAQADIGARLSAIKMRSKVELPCGSDPEAPAKPSVRSRLFWTPHELSGNSDV